VVTSLGLDMVVNAASRVPRAQREGVRCRLV